MAFLNGWKYRKALIISANDVDENVSNFAYLVYLDSSNFDFTKCNSDGSDIRFTASDGTTLLSFFREKHDSTNQVAIYHVKISTVSSSDDTTIYLYYGNSSATDASSDFQTVFGDSGLVAYYPFDGNANDLSGNHNGTWSGTEQYDTGILDKAAKFDGSSYIDLTVIDPGSIHFTVLTWINVMQYPSYNCRVFGDWHQDAGKDRWLLAFLSTGEININSCDQGSANHLYGQSTNITLNTDTWYHIAYTINATDGHYVFVNGEQKYFINVTYSSMNAPSESSFFGYQFNPAADDYFIGLASRPRIYNHPLDAAIISLIYKMENKSLFTFGIEETVGRNVLWFGTNF